MQGGGFSVFISYQVLQQFYELRYETFRFKELSVGFVSCALVLFQRGRIMVRTSRSLVKANKNLESRYVIMDPSFSQSPVGSIHEESHIIFKQWDVPARYLLRFGQGEHELATDLDFSRQDRVNAMLVRRLKLLSEVERLARSLHLPEDVTYTCKTAGYFWLLHVYSCWEQFLATCAQNQDKPTFVKDRFPFQEFSSNTPQLVFTGQSFEGGMRAAKGCFRHLSTVFQELKECRAFELLKSTADRANYLMTKHTKIVAMTCTHVALKRKDFLQLGFKYDNLLMEESAQILEIETFILMLLQRQENNFARLKWCILISE